jgi:hypothetical protein
VPQDSKLKKSWSKLFDSIQQSPSWAANIFSPIQETPALYAIPMLDNAHWHCSGPDVFTSRTLLLLLQDVYYSAIYACVLQCIPPISQTKPCFPYVKHTPALSFWGISVIFPQFKANAQV